MLLQFTVYIYKRFIYNKLYNTVGIPTYSPYTINVTSDVVIKDKFNTLILSLIKNLQNGEEKKKPYKSAPAFRVLTLDRNSLYDVRIIRIITYINFGI